MESGEEFLLRESKLLICALMNSYVPECGQVGILAFKRDTLTGGLNPFVLSLWGDDPVIGDKPSIPGLGEHVVLYCPLKVIRMEELGHVEALGCFTRPDTYNPVGSLVGEQEITVPIHYNQTVKNVAGDCGEQFLDFMKIRVYLLVTGEDLFYRLQL